MMLSQFPGKQKKPTIRAAALGVLRATDAVRDAVNGHGHLGTPHDHILGDVITEGVIHPCSPAVCCAACAGAQYGADDGFHAALGDLRRALGQEPKPWEARA